MAGLKKGIAVIGSTGSIGRQTLEVIRAFPNRFQVIALAAGSNSVLLSEQIMEFKPHYVYSKGKNCRTGPAEFLPLEDMLGLPEIDIVVMALSGLAGLKPTLWAVAAGKKIALANKEALVMAGALIMGQSRHTGAQILPIDSEHSAIWQCLKGEGRSVARIILTASGGPFLHYDRQRLETVTPEEALRHPSWFMGPKVTVDSATLLNKGFEVIEAHHLFGQPYESIKVLIHPPSRVHAMVEFKDGSVKAQLGYPDMRLPIQYALSYPNRWNNPSLPRIDWSFLGDLPFSEPDKQTFPCLDLAINAGIRGDTYPAALCGSGEACVELFLGGKIRFTGIPAIIERVLDEHRPCSDPDIETIAAASLEAWQQAMTLGKE